MWSGVPASSITRSVRAVQPLNAELLIPLTPEPMVSDVSAAQFWKAYSPTAAEPLPVRRTSRRAGQSLKAFSPIPATPGPKSTAVSAVQPEKASWPIFVAPLKLTDVSFSQLEKELLSRVASSSGKVTAVRLVPKNARCPR